MQQIKTALMMIAEAVTFVFLMAVILLLAIILQ